MKSWEERLADCETQLKFYGFMIFKRTVSIINIATGQVQSVQDNVPLDKFVDLPIGMQPKMYEKQDHYRKIHITLKDQEATFIITTEEGDKFRFQTSVTRETDNAVDIVVFPTPDQWIKIK